MEQKIRQDENIGENLKRLRMQKGLSQQKVCEVLQLMGCDIIRSTYQKYENGELNIKLQYYVNCRNTIIVVMKNFSNLLKRIKDRVHFLI